MIGKTDIYTQHCNTLRKFYKCIYKSNFVTINYRRGNRWLSYRVVDDKIKILLMIKLKSVLK